MIRVLPAQPDIESTGKRCFDNAGVRAGMLAGVAAYDVATFVVTPAVLIVIAAVAAVIPAWRASRIDPMRAIREA